MRSIPCFVFFVFIFSYCAAESSESDSLRNLIEKAKEDTVKVELLNALSKYYWTTASNPKGVIIFGKEAKSLSDKLHYRRGLAYAYKNIGIGYFNQGNYVEALQQYEQSIAMFDSIGDKKGLASMYSNLGNIYYNKADDLKAIELYLKSLRLAEQIPDSQRVITILNNIGAVYTNKKATYDKALEYLWRAYPLSLAINNIDEDLKNDLIGSTTVNIGEVYTKKYDEVDTVGNVRRMDLDSALFYLEKSLKAYEHTADLPYALFDIGKVYMRRKEYDLAIKYQTEGYDVAKKLNAQNDIAITLTGLAQAYEAKGLTELALAKYKEAEPIAEEIQANERLKDIFSGLSQVYSQLGDYHNAFKYQNRLIHIKDIMYNIDADKKLGTLQFT